MAAVTPQLFVEVTAAAAAERGATLVAEALATAGDGPTRTLTLAGGSTPKPLYRALTRREVPWDRVTVLFGDERVAPAGDPALNATMAQNELLDHVRPRAVHPVEVHRGPSAAAAHYAALLAPVGLDVVLLGMGRDGHTASLFPGGPEDGAAVIVTESPSPPPRRVSLSRSTLCRADTIVVFVTGAGKADRLARVWPQLFHPVQEATAPVARVRPRRRWWWVLDAAAAGGLPQDTPPRSGDDT